MSLLWNRKVAVTYGIKEMAGPLVSWNHIKVIGLRVAFEIEKTSESTPNPAKITIYNLGAQNWTILESTEPMVISLEVGYGDSLKEIFYGDITKSSFTRQGPDSVAVIEADDGGQAIREARIDKSYKAGVSLKTVIKDVVTTLKDAGRVAIDQVLTKLKSDDLEDKKTQTGLSISGASKDIMSKMMGIFGLEWHIQDNELKILEPTGNDGEEKVILTPKTGLIGTPIRRDNGIEFTALIQPNIIPGRLVKIESTNINGDFRVRKAKFIGDNYDQPWYITAEAIEA